MEPDRIEQSADFPVPPARLWHALTDYRHFGAWFGVRLLGPFQAGQDAHGPLTLPGCEHLTFHATVQEIEPQQYFAFTWHPSALDPAVNYSLETPTLVEFRLAPIPAGTRLTVTESGFSDLPDPRRKEAFQRNTEGWAHQLSNLAAYIQQNP